MSDPTTVMLSPYSRRPDVRTAVCVLGSGVNKLPSLAVFFYMETFTDWSLMREEVALMGKTKKWEIIQSGQKLKQTAIRLKGG